MNISKNEFPNYSTWLEHRATVRNCQFAGEVSELRPLYRALDALLSERRERHYRRMMQAMPALPLMPQSLN